LTVGQLKESDTNEKSQLVAELSAKIRQALPRAIFNNLGKMTDFYESGQYSQVMTDGMARWFDLGEKIDAFFGNHGMDEALRVFAAAHETLRFQQIVSSIAKDFESENGEYDPQADGRVEIVVSGVGTFDELAIWVDFVHAVTRLIVDLVNAGSEQKKIDETLISIETGSPRLKAVFNFTGEFGKCAVDAFNRLMHHFLYSRTETGKIAEHVRVRNLLSDSGINVNQVDDELIKAQLTSLRKLSGSSVVTADRVIVINNATVESRARRMLEGPKEAVDSDEIGDDE